MRDWEERAVRAVARHDDGAARLPADPDERQRQLTRMGNAAWAAGLAFLMAGDAEKARVWLVRAADRYRESWPESPPGSWGRPIGALKSRLIAGDLDGAADDARWALDSGAAASESPIGRYAAALARLVVGEDEQAAELAGGLRERGDFPRSVADAVGALASRDGEAYQAAISDLVRDFERRTEFLEDTPVADTVLALQVLARERGVDLALASPLLPA